MIADLEVMCDKAGFPVVVARAGSMGLGRLIEPRLTEPPVSGWSFASQKVYNKVLNRYFSVP